MSVTRIHPETGIHPASPDADIIRLPAPGKRGRKVHPSAGPFKGAIEWFMLVRRLQIDSNPRLTFEEAVEQANAECARSYR